ncbi:MAG TPA: acyltransferase, partial [Saprospiraceae bacterium]|nr:acyltransferase [Saprospiraceae bacterium]
MAAQTSPSPVSVRLDYLDSVRGLAALATLVGHWLHMFASPDQGIGECVRQRWDPLICGADGVSMFFVLSGLVLSLKYLRREGDMGLNYAEFLVNRFFRIYPACFVVLLFYFYSAHEQDATGNFLWRWLWGENRQFWQEASLIRNVSRYFGPVWTLNVEVMLSIIVPFLILLIRHKPRWFKYLWV